MAAHLPCVDRSREETLKIARSIAAAGVSKIVALCGDPSKGQTHFTPHPKGFTSTVELISALTKIEDFTLQFGDYPETHSEDKTVTTDKKFLKCKIVASSSEFLTWFFFESETFLHLRDAWDKGSIRTPITLGILPIETWPGAQRSAKAGKTQVSDWLSNAFS